MGELKLMVLSEPFGSGHERAAEAVIHAVKKLKPDTKAISLHTMQQFTPRLAKVFLQSYKMMLNVCPGLWGKFYEGSKDAANNTLEKMLLRFYQKGMKNMVGHHKPDVIICTHPFPALVTGLLKDMGQIKAPLVGVVTDFDVHGTWVHKHVDRYLLQDQSLVNSLTIAGIAEDRISVTGIPIHPRFSENVDSQRAKRALGFAPEQPLTVVAGGGWGLGPIEDIVDKLTAADIPGQLAVVTGKNYNLCKRLLQKTKGQKRIKVYGYVTCLSEFMWGADLLITKPGGLTSCEAMAQGLPTVLFEAFGGQETYNAERLVSRGAALKPHFSELAPTVRSVLGSPELRSQLREQAMMIARPNSATEAAKIIMGL